MKEYKIKVKKLNGSGSDFDFVKLSIIDKDSISELLTNYFNPPPKKVETRNLDDFTDYELVTELNRRNFNFIDETDKEDMIEFLENSGFDVCTQITNESELDLIDEETLQKITEKFIGGSWAEREEIYKKTLCT